MNETEVRERDEFREEMDAELPEAWMPQPGEVLVGTVKRYEQSETTYGPCYVCIVANEETGELTSVWLLQTALKSQFEKKQPEPGERIGLKYAGETQGKSGRAYHDYTLRVDRNPFSPWTKKPTPPPEPEVNPFDEAAYYQSEEGQAQLRREQEEAAEVLYGRQQR